MDYEDGMEVVFIGADVWYRTTEMQDENCKEEDK